MRLKKMRKNKINIIKVCKNKQLEFKNKKLKEARREKLAVTNSFFLNGIINLINFFCHTL